jgi:prepilin-type N-terminal cleavage/methylation domain-containing protein
MTASANRRRRGFTLIELLAVVLIMGVMLAIAMVAWPRMSLSLRLDDAMRQVASAMEHARQTAIRSRTNARFFYFGGDRGVVDTENPIVAVAISNTFYVSGYSGLSNTFMILPVYGSSQQGWGGRSGWSDSPKASLPVGIGLDFRVQADHANQTITFLSQRYAALKVGGGYPSTTGGEVYYGPGCLYFQPNNRQPCFWVGFNPRGEADVTATVEVYEVSAATMRRANGARYAQVITEAGSGHIRTVKP